MSSETTVAVADVFVLLLVALALVAIVSRRLQLPYTVALVLFGLLVSVVAPAIDLAITPAIVLTVLVPGLVFEAAFRLDLRELRSNLPAVSILAGPGVILGAAVTAVVLAWAIGLDARTAFLIGAMLSATDPVAVVATMRRLDAPPRLENLVEAESLFNDGTGIVLFSVGLTGVALVPEGLVAMAVTIVLSTVVGALVGVTCARVAGWLEDVNVELTLTVIAAYGSYLLADSFHESGIIATVVAGIAMGTAGRRGLLSARARVAIDTFWSYLAFLLAAIVFLLIGLSITPGDLAHAAIPIAWTFLALLGARALVVFGLVGLPSLTPLGTRLELRVPRGWLSVVFWSGLRGAIAVALALSLPADVPQRALAQEIVFGTVLVTLLVQGSSAGFLLRRLRLSGAGGFRHPDQAIVESSASAG